MNKKCIVCEEPAEFSIKDTNNYYCKSCAEENFADLSLLQKVIREVQIINKLVLETDGSNNQHRED